jgi:hypothetical protein
MAAFTPAITSSNCLEVVRLNRSISIFLVISNLFTSSRALTELHNSISPAADANTVLRIPATTEISVNFNETYNFI